MRSRPRRDDAGVTVVAPGGAGASVPETVSSARTLVELRGVRKSYGPVEVLHGVDLAVRDGEFLVVLGPSGSGKTTILRLIGGFVAPTAGEILLDGRDIAAVPINRRPFNTVFQDYALFPHMTVAENVGYGLMVRGTKTAVIRERVRDTLALVALGDFAGRLPAQLSGGQQQRVALARAIICEPRLILLDEPLGALDAELRRQMQGFLKQLQREIRTTFLFITHDQEEAVTMADRICVMRDGGIVQLGSPEEVYYRPATEYVARFFGDNNLIDGTVAAAGRVDTPLGPLAIASPLPAGTRVLVVVRPEAILIDPPPALRPRIEATVAEIAFAGPATQVLLRAAGVVLRARLPSRVGGPPVAVGDTVTIGWNADEGHLVAA